VLSKSKYFRHVSYLGLSLLLIIFLPSCNQEKNVVLFQAPANGDIQAKNDIVYKVGDLLAITLFSEDENLNRLFNVSSMGGSVAGGYTQGAPPPNGFLVDAEGFVRFPIIGMVKVAGIEKNELCEILRNKLIPFVKDPVFSIRLLNFKVTVMGEVYRPGTIYIPSDRVTVLDAIAISGDLQITARRDNVLVIREEDGKRKEYRLNLMASDYFNNEAFYLQQNDIIYVTPNKVKANSSAVNNANISLALSGISVIISFLILVTR
jgi:polysaccharide export outer membrane protein